MAERRCDGEALVVQLAHGPRHARRHRLDVEREVATRRLDPGGAEHCSGRMQDEVGVRQIRREHVGHRRGAGEQSAGDVERRAAAGERGGPHVLRASGHGDALGPVFASHVRQGREFRDRRQVGTHAAPGMGELERATRVARVQHDGSVRWPARFGERAGDGCMRKRRQRDNGNIRSANGRPDVTRDQLRHHHAFAQHALVGDPAQRMKRRERFGRPIPEGHLMSGQHQLRNRSRTARAGTKYRDLHPRLSA